MPKAYKSNYSTIKKVLLRNDQEQNLPKIVSQIQPDDLISAVRSFRYMLLKKEKRSITLLNSRATSDVSLNFCARG